MIENWRLFGRVRVGLSVFISEDSLLCLLVNMLIAYYTTSPVRDNDRMLLIVPSCNTDQGV